MPHRNPFIVLALAGTCVALLCACAAGVKVNTMEVDDAKLHERTSFAWVDRSSPRTGPADDRVAREVDEEVHKAAVSELIGKGYTEASPDAADLLVSHQVVVTDAGLADTGEPRSGMSPLGTVGAGDPFRELRDRGTTPRNVTESAGTLLVLITDRSSGRILWRGTAESPMTSRREGVREVPAAVRRMFEKFPSRAQAASR